MPKTRRVFDMIETLAVDPDLVRDLLLSRSMLDAAAAYTSLRGVVPDGALLMLANLREVIAEIPETPFLTGQPIEILEHVADYERCVNSYRRAYRGRTQAGFTLEFIGQGTECEAIVIEVGASRFNLAGDMEYMIDPEVLDLALEHRTLIDEILRALQTLGVALDPARLSDAGRLHRRERGRCCRRDVPRSLLGEGPSAALDCIHVVNRIGVTRCPHAIIGSGRIGNPVRTRDGPATVMLGMKAELSQETCRVMRDAAFEDQGRLAVRIVGPRTAPLPALRRPAASKAVGLFDSLGRGASKPPPEKEPA